MLVENIKINGETQVWYSCPDNNKVRESLERIGKDYMVQNGVIFYPNPKRYIQRRKS